MSSQDSRDLPARRHGVAVFFCQLRAGRARDGLPKNIWYHPIFQRCHGGREIAINRQKLIRHILIAGLALMLVPSTHPAQSSVESWAYYGDANGDELGHAVSTAGNLVPSEGVYADIVVGAPGDTDPEEPQSSDRKGVVYVFGGGLAGLAKDYAWHAAGEKGSRFGAAVAGAGDMDGDGWDDLVVGAHSYKPGDLLPQAGAVYLYCGPLDPLHTSSQWSFLGDSKAANVGYSVGAAGDMNNDGHDDLIIGAWHWQSNVETFDGAVLLFYGNGIGSCDLGTEPDWVYESEQAGARLGASVASAHDVNDDGIDDLIMGAPGYDGDDSLDEGAAYVFYGSDTGPGGQPDWIAYGGQEGAWFGISVSTAGDVNGDGWDDIIVGASRYDDRYEDEGAAFVFYGPLDGDRSPEPDWVAYGRQAYVQFGASVSTARDADGDGYDDVLVGAPNYNKNGEGAAFIFYGSAEGLAKVSGWRATGDKADTEFGYSVSETGDVRGDGTGGIVVGAPVYKRDDKTPLGKAAAFYGPLLPTYYRAYLPVILH